MRLRLPTIPPPYVGWIICLGMVCSLGLSVFAVIDIHEAGQARRDYVTLGAAARTVIDSLKARRCVVLGPEDAVIRRQPVRSYP